MVRPQTALAGAAAAGPAVEALGATARRIVAATQPEPPDTAFHELHLQQCVAAVREQSPG